MQTTELKADWNRRAAGLTDAQAGVRRNLLAPLLRFAAVNAPVADAINLFRLHEAAPTAAGTLVPDRHAPADLPRLDVFVRAPRPGRGVAPTPAPSRPAAAPPAAARPALPSNFRTALRSVAADTVDAAEILAQVADEETGSDYEALRAAAASAGGLAEREQATPADALRDLEAIASALVRARAANELASFVLGTTGDDLARRLAEMVVQAGELRDRPLTPAPARAAAPAEAAVPAPPAPEWEAQRWADLTPCLSDGQIGSRMDDRRETFARAGLPDALEETLAFRLTDPDELAAAVQVATFIVEVAGGSEGGELPAAVAPARMGDVLAAGVDAAVGWLRPIVRANAERLDYGDCSWMAVAPAAEKPAPPAAVVGSEPGWEKLMVIMVADFLHGTDLHDANGVEGPDRTIRELQAYLQPVLPAGELPLLAAHAVKWFAALHPATRDPLIKSHRAGGEELRTWVQTVVDDTRVVSAATLTTDRADVGTLPAVPAPSVAVVAAPAEPPTPEPINERDWIEWDAGNGTVQRGRVETIWQVGPIVPGRKSIPHDEYTVLGVGTVRPEHRPRRVAGPFESQAVAAAPAAPATTNPAPVVPTLSPLTAEGSLAANFLASTDLGSPGVEAALAGRLAAVLPPAELPRATRRILVTFALKTPGERDDLLNEHRAGGDGLARWAEAVVDDARRDQAIDDEHEADLRARVEAGDETARPELDRVEWANAAVAENTASVLGQIQPAANPDEPDLDELEAEAAAEEATALTVPVPSIGQVGEADEEVAGLSARDLHAGHFRAWFLSTPARERLEITPWTATLAAGVNPADYVLVADVRGAHAHEVFARLQNGLGDWADGVDPGAVVRLNMDAPDGRLRRRSMDFGDLLEDVATGECRMVALDDLMPLESLAGEIGLTMPGKPRWQSVAVRPGFDDLLEAGDAAEETVGLVAAVGGGGRGRRR